MQPRRTHRSGKAEAHDNQHRMKKEHLILAALFAALSVRLILAPLFNGHPVDITCFMSWADEVYNRGFLHFYRPGYFCDYPPLYLYVLYFIGMAKKALIIPSGSPFHLLLIKMPSIIADIATSYLIYQVARSRVNERISIAISLSYALNPAIILNSTIWGQVDSILTLLLMFTIKCIIEDRLETAAVIYGLSILFKPQGVFLLPLIFLSLLATRNLKRSLLCLILGTATFILFSLAFTLNQWPSGILNIYIKLAKSYPYATLNAFNLYAIFNGNWGSVSRKLLFLPVSTWSFILTTTFYLYIMVLHYRSKVERRHYLTATLFIFTAFMVMTSMHERYLYPALGFAILSFATLGDRRLLFIYAGLSASHLVNVGIIYKESLKNNFFTPIPNSLIVLFSLANILLFYATLMESRNILAGIPKGISNKL